MISISMRHICLLGAFFFYLIFRCQSGSVVELNIGQSTSKQLISRGTTKHFCISTSYGWISSIYKQVNIYAIISNARDEFDWHTVRGKSTDDFHSTLQSLIHKITDPKNEYRIDTNLDEELDLESSFLRDMVSACPSPIFHGHNKQVCRIPFTTNGRSCISVTANSKALPITVLAKYETNYLQLVYLIFGILFILSASHLSESALFQYTFGITFFISTATILIFLFILHRSGSQLTKSVIGIVIMFAGYTTSLIWFLKNYMRSLILSYWEFGVFYAVVMLLISLVVIQQINLREKPRHTFRVGIKWMIRLAGVIFMYNATSSPTVSLLLFGCLVLRYIIYAIIKPFRKSKSKDKVKKDRRYRE